MKHSQLSAQILNVKDKRLSDDEIRMLAEIEVHPKIREWNTDAHTDDVEEMYRLFRKFFSELPTNERQSFLVAKVQRKTAGFAGIYRKSGLMSHIGTVGIAVHPNCQRRGIGTKLLMELVELSRTQGFKRLEADTLANNKPMRRLAQKVGFKLEGIRKKRIKKNDRYLNEVLLALILS